MDRDKYEFVEIRHATIPRDGLFDITCDAWWVVTPDDEIMYYRGVSGQYNYNKVITEKIRDKIYPGCEVRQIPVVYRKINPRDYV